MIESEQYLVNPSGEFYIGFQDFHLINPSLGPDPYYKKGENEGSFTIHHHDYFREIMVRIYYPSYQKTPRSHYYQPFNQKLVKFFFLEFNNIPEITKNDVERISRIHSFTVNNSEVVNAQCPTIIFKPAYGMQPQYYENIITHLASNGYIIVGISNTFIGENTKFPDGRIVPLTADREKRIFDVSTSDILFVYKELVRKEHFSNGGNLINRIDLSRITLLGHSLGAIDAINIARGPSNPFNAIRCARRLSHRYDYSTFFSC